MNDMTHNIQDLIASERERWLKLHLEGGLTIVELKKRSGFSRDTLHRRKSAYLAHGLAGLGEKSRAHHAHPKTTAPEIVSLIQSIRSESPMPGAERIALRMKKRHGKESGNSEMQFKTAHKRKVKKIIRRFIVASQY